MIGKGKAISHTKASIEYGWNQEKDAKVVFKQNLAGETPNEVTQEFKIIQSMNEKCNRNTFSFVISPTIEDGKKVSLKQLNTITKEFINNLKLIEHQAIAFIHQDKAHKHIHLYVNRIGFDGKAYKDNFIGKRSQKTAEIVAKKLSLQTVKQVQALKLENLKDIRKYIKEKHEASFNFFHPENHSKYIKKMKEFDITLKPVISKSNKFQGFRYQFKNANLKGSEVHRSLSINKLNALYLEVAKTIQNNISKSL